MEITQKQHDDLTQKQHMRKIQENNMTFAFKKTGTSQVGAISKAQKGQNIFFGKNLKFVKKNFFRKKAHSAKKCERGDPF